MVNYYNEYDKHAAQWLRNLIEAGLLPPGDVDERPIQEVEPYDLQGYNQCHFFAGIGGWPLALQLAGWPTDRPVWTGSCPCQPFSVAGKRKGTADARHLWPVWFNNLIRECEPATCFGEQVASKAGRAWLAGVRVDLEEVGYAVGAADLCAAGVSAPHIRQRLFWMADGNGHGYRGTHETTPSVSDSDGQDNGLFIGNGRGRLVQSFQSGLEGHAGHKRPVREIQGREKYDPARGSGSDAGGIPDTERLGLPGQPRRGAGGEFAEHGAGHGTRDPFWGDYIIIPCADGKARRIEPGLMPLAHGVSGRVVKIRGYGNAIVPALAAEFIKVCMAVTG